MEDFLSRSYMNNTIQDYLIAAAGIVIGVILIPLFRKVLLRPFRTPGGKNCNQDGRLCS